MRLFFYSPSFSLLFLELRFDLFLDGCVCREEFRKEFKEKNPKNKSVAAVSSPNESNHPLLLYDRPIVLSNFDIVINHFI